MDVATVLRAARARSLMSQADLAKAASTSRSAITAYENGKVSPSVSTLDRLLAACRLQLRVTLEPLLAHVDARIDELLAGTPELDLARLAAFAASLEDAPGAPRFGIGSPLERRGPVSWAYDGATALQLHGLAVDTFGVGLVVVLDEALRFWLRAVQMQGQTPRGDVFMSWLDADLDTLQRALRDWAYCHLGPAEIRIVEQLPATVQVQPVGGDRPLPVVTVDAVEQAHPGHAELLARLRQRRSLGT